jgi:hypothetical protein
MPRRLPALVALLVLVLGAVAAFGSGIGLNSDEGAIPSATGAPAIGGITAEFNCTLCHQDYANPCLPGPCNLATPGGGVALLDVPADYLPGSAIPLRVRVWTDSTLVYPGRNWGFQITAVRESDGSGAGTWILPDPDSLQVVGGSGAFTGRSYLEQTVLGIRGGLAGPVEWSFTWMPPAGNEGRVIFCLAGTAGNGDDVPGGEDFVFVRQDTLAPNVVPVRRASWGGVKAKYR